MASFVDPFLPRWKRSEEAERLAGITELDPVNQVDILQQLALQDPSPAVRKKAVERIEKESSLLAICEDSQDEEVIEIAQKRLEMIAFKKLTEQFSEHHPWPMWLQRIRDEKKLEEIVLNGTLLDLCLAALQRIHNREILIHLGKHLHDKRLALSVIEKLLDDQEALKILSRQGANKVVRQKAKELIEKEQGKESVKVVNELTIRKRCEEIVTYAEATCPKTYNFSAVAERLQQLRKELDELENLDGEYHQRFHRALQIFEERRQKIESYQETQLKQISYQQELESKKRQILEELKNVDPTLEEAPQKVQMLVQQWKEIPVLAIESKETELQKLYREIVQPLEQKLLKVQEERQQMAEIANRLQNFREAVHSDDERILFQMLRFRPHWPEKPLLDFGTLREQWKEVIQQIRHRIRELKEKEQENVRQFHNQLKEIIDEINTLAEGEISQKYYNRVRELQKEWQEKVKGKDIPPRLQDAYRRSLDRFFMEYREYREEKDWEAWHCKTQKQELITKVAGLSKETDLQLVAKVIREAQQEWKKIGYAHDDQKLWEEFHAICDREYERCREYFRGLDEQRQKNQEVCEKLCEQAESLKDSTNWHETAQALRELQKTWQEHGYLPKATAEELYRRFRSACDYFFDRYKKHLEELEAARVENQRRREEILQQLEALNQQPRPFLPDYLKLREAWQNCGPGLREQHELLRQRFREQSDRFFQRLDEFRESIVPEKKKICEEIQAFLDTLDDQNTNWQKALQQIKEWQEKWQELGPLPKNKYQELEQIYNQLLDRFYERRKQALAKLQETYQANLEKKRQLVAEAKSLVENQGYTQEVAERLKQIQAAWKEVGHVPYREDEELWEELHHLCDTFFARRSQQWQQHYQNLQKNLKEKMEIIAALQQIIRVSRRHASRSDIVEKKVPLDLASELKIAFEQNFAASASSFNRDEEVRQLQRRWQQIGPVPKEEAAKINHQYQELLDIYYGRNKRRTSFSSSVHSNEFRREKSKESLTESQEPVSKSNNLSECTPSEQVPPPESLSSTDKGSSALPGTVPEDTNKNE